MTLHPAVPQRMRPSHRYCQLLQRSMGLGARGHRQQRHLPVAEVKVRDGAAIPVTVGVDSRSVPAGPAVLPTQPEPEGQKALAHRITARRVLVAAGLLAVVIAILSPAGTQALRFSLLGLGEGALIAAIGLGVVLTFRGSGFINFG